MEKQKKKYSDAFKVKAVELSNLRGNIITVAQELGIRGDMLRRWIREHKEGKFKPDFKKLVSKEDEEIKRLKKELLDTKLERDILKKAVSIFSKSDR